MPQYELIGGNCGQSSSRYFVCLWYDFRDTQPGFWRFTDVPQGAGSGVYGKIPAELPPAGVLPVIVMRLQKIPTV
jgi:hypothetical protein